MPLLRGVSHDGAHFLDRYANELSLLAKGLDGLQHSLGDVYAGALTDQARQDLQRLDAFTQTATILARIANQLAGSPTLDHTAVAALISTVNLADVAARLAGEPTASPANAGDIEVF